MKAQNGLHLSHPMHLHGGIQDAHTAALALLWLGLSLLIGLTLWPAAPAH